MTNVLRVDRKELTSGEILDEVEAGKRVIIEVDMLGKTVRMAIRKREDTYYCDTPIKLLTFDTEAELQTCLERYKLAKVEEGMDETGVSRTE
ncbi:hypothetical protein [Halorubrum vacuolatum]|uniref:DUF8001 domain-containing protein n=1 Tax=Halorubrum vacuolatum TaxID=63740 RepID=A0A238WXV6_HALVU|nr:hypothetical protein [Halorubrum vacuolatum]SNR51330.1 hypothetical protein SAMN06264855_11133 [Halorubrum vacuolatum]